MFDYKDEGKIRGWKSVHVTDNSPDHPYMDNWWVPGLAIGYDASFTHQVADFIQGWRPASRQAPTFRDALETQHVLDAILDSAKRQKWVTWRRAEQRSGCADGLGPARLPTRPTDRAGQGQDVLCASFT